MLKLLFPTRKTKSIKPSPFFRNQTLLDAMHDMGDPAADTVFSKLLSEGDIDKTNAVLRLLVQNDNSLSGNVPPILKAFLVANSALPTWADKNKIQRAQEMFTSQGAFFGLVLMSLSLPILYAGGKGGSQVLSGTGQLTGHFRRRASQTLRFILDTMEPGGLNPDGKGLRAIQKVRLMHAAIRHYAHHSPMWKNRSAWGQPINQEELAGTLLAFSSVAIDGLHQLDIEFSAEDEECYLHTWKVIGHLLGVCTEMLPHNMEDARELWMQIKERNFVATPEGHQLALDHLAFLKDMVPGHLFDSLPASLMHFLMGGKISHGILGLPRPGWTYFIIAWIRALFDLEGKIVLSSKTLRKLTSAAGELLMESLYHYWNEGDGSPFQIPKGLDKV